MWIRPRRCAATDPDPATGTGVAGVYQFVRSLAVVILSPCLILAACSGPGGGSAAPETTVRDSAGIRVVENPPPAFAPSWKLEPLPVASIGDGMGDPALELHEVTDVVVLADGSIVIANAGTHEVRLYSPSGRPGPAAGGPGEGPGEFMGEIQLACMPGDSILAYDWALRRATVLDRHATVGRTIDLRHLDPNVDLRGVMSDGTLVLSLRHLQLSEGLNADSVVFVRTDTRGSPIDWPGWARFSRLVLRQFNGPPVIDDLPFGPTGQAAAVGSGMIVLDGIAPQYVVRGDGGMPTMIVRWDALPATITQGMIDRFVDWDRTLERRYVSPTDRERWLESIDFPAVAPATSGLVIDSNGARVFVEEWRPPWAPGDAAWLVFAADGRMIARLEVPTGLDVLAVSGDLVAGLERDDLDVEHVRVYRIEG